MCLAFRKSNPLQRRVATEDITIYKVVSKNRQKNFVSRFQRVGIKLEKLYTSILEEPNEDGWNTCSVDSWILRDDDLMFISIGLHAFTEDCFNSLLIKKYLRTLERSMYGKVYLLKGRVPVGSEYYVNEETGMIVASSMIYDEEIILLD